MSIKGKKLFSHPLFVAGLLSLIVIIITGQSLLLKPKISNGIEYTRYNNYVIFKQSFFHLSANKDLYQLHPDEHLDYYKYSPAFAVLIAPLAHLPDALGLFTWNLLNVLVLFFALWKLPFPSNKKRLLVCGFILIELITSIQNSQSNGLMAGLIIFAFLFLEKKQTALAALFIVLTVFIKLFGLVALSLFIFYPNKGKAMVYVIGWTVMFAILPLIIVPLPQLLLLHQSWFDLLYTDHSSSLGLSVAGWTHSWFGIEAKNMMVLIGAVLLGLPLFKQQCFHDLKFKLWYLSSVLIWMVIFNHKAESPTFIIAVSGVAIWFFSRKIKTENLILLIAVLILTILSPTDIFPKGIRNSYVVPYVLKAVPCIIVWMKITADLLLYKKDTEVNARTISDEPPINRY